MTNKQYIDLPKEFVTSLLFMMHELLEALANSNMTPKEAERILDKLQATERYYFEAQDKELA
jgi:hypothetical protein